MDAVAKERLLIDNCTVVDGLGSEAKPGRQILIENRQIAQITGNNANDGKICVDASTQIMDATGRYVMPGLIDGHCHLTFGYAAIGDAMKPGSTESAELCTLNAALNAQVVLSAGVTGISVPGGAWFADVAIRDAINAGLMKGPRVFPAGRFLSTYDTIADPDPCWISSPEHGIGVLVNTADEMVTEVRRQIKQGVDLIKVGDSPWGDEQMISLDELQAVVGEAHRRNTKVTIHARGAGSTKIAAEAGVDWIMHADFAREAELEVVARKKIPIMPSLAALEVICTEGPEIGLDQSLIDQVKRNRDLAIEMLEISQRLGITLLCGTDTGNSPIMKYGKYHALEPQLLVRYAGYTPAEAIKAATSDNAISIGRFGSTGAVAEGYEADLLILDENPLDDIACIENPSNIQGVIKGGEIINRESIPSVAIQQA
ncbi:amidohydrolase family protein [Salinisphaera sp.]|uniref:metal-dependent hydrolase family protein n=1 Tax=Salinisphaera sp. TaxID=1914330 RepID=UPI002D76F702|nr:amidohydrolase family protein [Salinisphaera sp.]HET7314635.1 amidohydrolase family protein [Salinisphaera sp.]